MKTIDSNGRKKQHFVLGKGKIDANEGAIGIYKEIVLRRIDNTVERLSTRNLDFRSEVLLFLFFVRRILFFFLIQLKIQLLFESMRETEHTDVRRRASSCFTGRHF